MKVSTSFGTVKVVMLKGEKGDKFQFEDYTPEELESLRGEKGDAFTYEDFTEEQLEGLRSEVASAYYRKVDATYYTIGDNTETIAIPIEGYNDSDMLFVDVEGLALTEGVDYTIEGSSIVLTEPITHNYTAVNFRALRAFAITTEDYDSFIGDLTSDLDSYVDEWLTEHPEATTTVQDGTITDAKLAQVGGVLSKVNDFSTLSAHDMLGGVAFEQGSLNPSTGADMSSTTRIRCGYIPLENVTSFSISVESGYQYIVDWFDSSKNTLYGFNDHGTWQTANKTYDASKFGNAAYIRFLFAKADGSNIQASEASNLHVSYTDAFTTLSGLVEKSHIVNGESFSWQSGTIQSGMPSPGNARIRSEKIPMGKGSVINVNSGTTSPYKQIIAHYYDAFNGSYLGQSTGWTREPIIVPYDCDVIILVSNTSGTEITDDQKSTYAAAVTVQRSLLLKSDGNQYVSDGFICTSASSYFEPIGTNGGVWCKFNTLWIRGSLNKDITWANVLSGNKGTSPAGVSDCLYIPHNNSLVYDIDASAIAIVASDSRKAYSQIPLLIVGTSGTGESILGGKLYHMFVEYEANKSAVTQTVTNALDYALAIGASDETEQFIYFTDPHLMGSANDTSSFLTAFNKYIEAMEAYFASTPTTFVMCGGDWLNSGDNPNTAKFKLGFACGRCKQLGKYYGVVGNHDTNYLGVDENGTANSGTLSNETISSVMFGSEHANYYSFDGAHTRFYVFDSGTDWDTSMTEYRWEQVAWFANALLEDDKPHSAISIHIWYTNYNDPTADTISALATNIASVIAAYNERTSVTLNGATYNYVSSTGHVEFIICGHTHFDKSGSSGSVPVVNTLNMQNGSTPSFDLVYVDYESRQLYTVRVGTGSDRVFDLDVTS